MGGDPEHADHLQALLESYPHFYLDTSATKWQVREVSAHRDAIRALVCRFPDRFLFGSDVVAPTSIDAPMEVFNLYTQLWKALTPAASEAVRLGNYQRLFDAARVKVRAWEKANAGKRQPVPPWSPSSGDETKKP